MTSTTDPRVDGRSPLAQITRGVVHVHHAYFGKGPTRARTDQIGDDGVVCVLRESLTSVELTLIDRGHADQVKSLRRAFQDAMEPEFTAVIEQALGRRVVAFLSQVSLEPDIATEIFFMEPR